jgi:ArsR family metal-binding transcriptional regulator
VLQEAIDAASSKRRMIGVWDPEIAAVMQYLKSTTPRYSISESAAKWIKEGLERDHPELIKKVREDMKGRKL